MSAWVDGSLGLIQQNPYFLLTFFFRSPFFSLPPNKENPSEEDAAIVDKVLSMRVVKKEVRPLYLLLHAEWDGVGWIEC